MPDPILGFNRPQADTLLSLIRERKLAGRVVVPGLELSPKRTFVIDLDDPIPALEYSAGAYHFSYGDGRVLLRDQTNDRVNSQDPADSLVAGAINGSTLVAFTDINGDTVYKRVFNLTKAALAIQTPYLAHEDQFGDLYIDRQAGGSTIPECHFYGFRLYRQSDGYISGNTIKSDKPGSIFWTASEGNITGCHLEVKTATAASYTDYAVKVLEDGWYDFDWRVTGYENVGNVSGSSSWQTRTSENGGAVAAHSHTFTGDNNTTASNSGHIHTISAYGINTDTESAHTHTLTSTGTIANAGSSSGHTHDVKMPMGYYHGSALCRIYYRASGGSESDWDLVAFASTGTYVLPHEYVSVNGSPYHSAAPRGMRYLAANTELAFRLQYNGLLPSGFTGEYLFASNRALTNLTVRYLGNSITTNSHYP